MTLKSIFLAALLALASVPAQAADGDAGAIFGEPLHAGCPVGPVGRFDSARMDGSGYWTEYRHASANAVWVNPREKVDGAPTYLKPFCGPLMRGLITSSAMWAQGKAHLYLFFDLDMSSHMERGNSPPFAETEGNGAWAEYWAAIM